MWISSMNSWISVSGFYNIKKIGAKIVTDFNDPVVNVGGGVGV
jgi:hypothetical protein